MPPTCIKLELHLIGIFGTYFVSQKPTQKGEGQPNDGHNDSDNEQVPPLEVFCKERSRSLFRTGLFKGQHSYLNVFIARCLPILSSLPSMQSLSPFWTFPSLIQYPSSQRHDSGSSHCLQASRNVGSVQIVSLPLHLTWRLPYLSRDIEIACYA